MLELLITIAIISVLAVLAVVGVGGAVEKSNQKQLSFIRSAIENAANNYRIYNDLSINTNLGINNLSSASEDSDFLDTLTYRRGKECPIDENAGYLKYVEVEQIDSNNEIFYTEEYCIYFVCSGEVIIDDYNTLDYCE